VLVLALSLYLSSVFLSMLVFAYCVLNNNRWGKVFTSLVLTGFKLGGYIMALWNKDRKLA
jgi:hypothetical protein